MKKLITILIVLSVMALGACAPAMDAEEPATIANPASVYCEEQDGAVELRTNEDGSVTGYCIFADGSECEEWAFYRGECGPESEMVMKSPPSNAKIGNAYVDSSELALEENDLLIVLQGNLPDPCHHLYVEIGEPNEANQINITVNSWIEDNGFACIQVLEPFKTTVSIPTGELADGEYTILVNEEEIGAFSVSN